MVRFYVRSLYDYQMKISNLVSLYKEIELIILSNLSNISHFYESFVLFYLEIIPRIFSDKFIFTNGFLSFLFSIEVEISHEKNIVES